MKRILAPIGCMFLFACASDPGAALREANRTTPQILVERPIYPGYGAAVGQQRLNWTHASLAEDFGKIMFETEWGARLSTLLKWDERVEIAIASDELNAFRPEIAEYLAVLNTNTPDLSIALVTGAKGDITLRSAPAERMAVDVPATQCFVAPGDMDWQAFVEASGKGEINWERVELLEKSTIFIPTFAAPHSIRACISEEIIQALGPGNDLYGLEDSLFNDDGAHVWPTAFDLRILNILYSDNLAPGMNRETAVEAAKAALARTTLGEKQRVWSNIARLYHTEYHRYLISTDTTAKERALDRADKFSGRLPQNDHRRGEVLRLQAFAAEKNGDIKKAVTLAEEAISVFRLGLPENSPRMARILSDYGYFLSEDSRYEKALVALDEALPVLAAHAVEDEFVLSLRLKAFAHLSSDDRMKAQSAARETIAWARYAYGADSTQVRTWSDEFRSHDLSL